MFYNNNFTLGVLGGGQLGRMLIQEAINLDIRVAILDPSSEAPCKNIAHEFVQGDFNNYNDVYNFGKDKDVITIEIEHVNVEALKQLEKEGKKIFPQPAILEIIKDKGLQKEFYAKHNIATSNFYMIESSNDLKTDTTKFPLVQKLRTGGYDGKGVQIINSIKELEKAFDAPSVIEELIDFEKEISVIAARNESGELSVFPVVDMEFNSEANLVEFLYSPATISKETENKAYTLAKKVANAFDFVGLLAIEMFVTKDGDVMVNEVAPRPHNSGHHTIEGNYTSQYEQHLRSILNLPLGSTEIIQPAVMLNLLGDANHSGIVKYEGIEAVLKIEGANIHIYGKKETKPFRKMGHITIIDNNLGSAKIKALRIKELIKVIRQ